ncbi:hypothetical protein [Gloeothece verrucosa]|uniref:Uncharacterized protein n=1 Tax=Gloeothece verrucosa (strain PCC 7822) TaxID=497965 RepID=E0UNL5_GLOV7|nr:hypothetical protein [Gloeothece verrucosa]ADN18545.1 hypothetical protein Cyan7822_6901 [Gloeothece verrucosa PCC 7822]
MNSITLPSSIRDEFTLFPDGSTRTSSRGAARLAGVDEKSLTKLGQKLIEQGFVPRSFFQAGIPLKAIHIIIQHYAFEAGSKCTQKAFNNYYQLNNLPIPHQKFASNKVTRVEDFYRNSWAAKLNGQIEVSTPAGKIDILTSSEVIEVKNLKNWQAALGQVLVYSDYFPSHSRRIILMENPSPEGKRLIENHCRKLNIIVTFAR